MIAINLPLNLDDLFSYNPLTGVILWKIKPHIKVNVGTVAGCVALMGRDKKPYSLISYKQKIYRSHHIALALSGVTVPPGMVVDHIDGDGTNNKLANLRVVSIATNNLNKKLGKNNKTGLLGVYFYKNRNKWRASINKSGKSYFLGHFNTLLDACCKRKSAEIGMGFHANHGRVM